MASPDKETDKIPRHVVIVGGGLAGLMAARTLLREGTAADNHCLRISLVEAQAHLGGRLQANTTFCPGYPVDMGAEFIHCTDTLLTELISDLHLSPRDEWEEYFVTAHADGGPDEAPTKEGKYGMYYVDGKLLMYNDASLKPLEHALHNMMEQGVTDPSISVGRALLNYDLPPALRRLAVSGYGNTAGSTDLERLSLCMLTRFENHWETNETEGDYRLPKEIGTTAVVRALEKELRRHENFEIRCNWPASLVENAETTKCPIVLHGPDGQSLPADAVIVTVPPPLLSALLPFHLTTSQKTVLSQIGFETVCKVLLKFSARPWPAHLQSIVCADGGPLPEVWFREFDANQKVMVGYLASQMADDFLDLIHDEDPTVEKHNATQAGIQQLATMLSLEEADLTAIHVDTLVHVWNATREPYVAGGYMYPAVGLTTLEPLAEPCMGGRVFLAGEATNTGACCTMQAALETGQRAAHHVSQLLKSLDVVKTV